MDNGIWKIATAKLCGQCIRDMEDEYIFAPMWRRTLGGTCVGGSHHRFLRRERDPSFLQGQPAGLLPRFALLCLSVGCAEMSEIKKAEFGYAEKSALFNEVQKALKALNLRAKQYGVVFGD